MYSNRTHTGLHHRTQGNSLPYSLEKRVPVEWSWSLPCCPDPDPTVPHSLLCPISVLFELQEVFSLLFSLFVLFVYIPAVYTCMVASVAIFSAAQENSRQKALANTVAICP